MNTVGESLISEKQAILFHAKQRGSITRKEVEKLVDLKTTKALCDEGFLAQQVNGKYTCYTPLQGV